MEGHQAIGYSQLHPILQVRVFEIHNTVRANAMRRNVQALSESLTAYSQFSISCTIGAQADTIGEIGTIIERSFIYFQL